MSEAADVRTTIHRGLTLVRELLMQPKDRGLKTIVDGVQCPKCNGESCVIDSRDGETSRRRRRKCSECGHRYTTYEVHVEEYDRLQTLKVNTKHFDSMINTLHAIKAQFGDSNGLKKPED